MAKAMTRKFYNLLCMLFLAGLAFSQDLVAPPAAPQWKKRSTLEVDQNDSDDKDEELESKTKAPDKKEPEATVEKKSTKPEPEQKIEISSPEPSADEDDDEEDGNPDITLNFNDASLSNLIGYMADMKKINLIPSPDTAEVKVSLNMRDAMSKEEAWEVFTTLLDIGGFCIVRAGKLHKVIKKEAKHVEPHPVYMGTPAERLPDSSQTIRFITFLRNLGAAEVEPLIKNFLDKSAQIIVQQTMNALIITDKAESIKHAMGIINELDNSGIKETCQILRLNKATAADVKKFLDELIKKPDTSTLARLLGQQSEGSADYFPGTVKLISEDRTNSLIMLGTPATLKKLETFITEYFEGNWRTRTPFFPYECQYVESDHVKSVLDEIISSEAAAAKAGISRGGARYLGNIRIESDKYSNKLIIYSQDKKDLDLVKEIISDLDKPQPMVALETLIIQVTQTDDKEFGGQIRNKTHGQPIPGVNVQSGGLGSIETKSESGQIVSILGNLISKVQSSGQGSTVLTVGDGSREDVWAVFKAVKKLANTNVIANTFVTVANRVKTNFSVGDTQRIVSEKGQGDTDQLSGFTNASASTDVSFTPQISPDGLISLDMDVKISEFVEGTERRGDTTRNELRTSVTMSDGQILILGGFVKTKVLESKVKTPIFGDIPIFGWLAKGKTRNVTKNYIFIFVSPTIVKPRKTPGSGVYTKIKLHDAERVVKDSTEAEKSRDPIQNSFFNYSGRGYSHKIVDFANARYQPTTVDLRRDELYRGKKIELEQQESITESDDEDVRIGNDKVKLTSITSKPIEQSFMQEQKTLHEFDKEPESRSVKSKDAAAKTPRARARQKKSTKPNLQLIQKDAHKPEVKRLAQQRAKTNKQLALKPRDQGTTIDFDQMMKKRSGKNRNLGSEAQSALKQAKSMTPEGHADFGLDQIFERDKTAESLPEKSLDEIFAPKNKKRKKPRRLLSEFEEDFLDPEAEKIVRSRRFASTLDKDAGKASDSLDIESADDFDRKMQSRGSRGKKNLFDQLEDKKPAIKPKKKKVQALDILAKAGEYSDNMQTNSVRERKFKRLLTKNRPGQDIGAEDFGA